MDDKTKSLIAAYGEAERMYGVANATGPTSEMQARERARDAALRALTEHVAGIERERDAAKAESTGDAQWLSRLTIEVEQLRRELEAAQAERDAAYRVIGEEHLSKVRAALAAPAAQPQAEPIAWANDYSMAEFQRGNALGGVMIVYHKPDAGATIPLYAAPAQPAGDVVVTTNDRGQCVAVTRQDDEGRILSVIWERG